MYMSIIKFKNEAKPKIKRMNFKFYGLATLTVKNSLNQNICLQTHLFFIIKMLIKDINLFRYIRLLTDFSKIYL